MGYILCISICFALIGFCVGIAGAIVMGVTNENQCGDGCREADCMTEPCTCGLLDCEDYAVKSDNSGNTAYVVGVALTGAGFGTFALIIICTLIYGFCCSENKSNNELAEEQNGNPSRHPDEINMVMSPGVQN